MKALKWILLVAAAAASVAAVVFAVFRRVDACGCMLADLFRKGKGVVQPCYEKVVGFFNEDDFGNEEPIE